jgi:hypothetical protein
MRTTSTSSRENPVREGEETGAGEGKSGHPFPPFGCLGVSGSLGKKRKDSRTIPTVPLGDGADGPDDIFRVWGGPGYADVPAARMAESAARAARTGGAGACQEIDLEHLELALGEGRAVAFEASLSIESFGDIHGPQEADRCPTEDQQRKEDFEKGKPAGPLGTRDIHGVTRVGICARRSITIWPAPPSGRVKGRETVFRGAPLWSITADPEKVRTGPRESDKSGPGGRFKARFGLPATTSLRGPTNTRQGRPRRVARSRQAPKKAGPDRRDPFAGRHLSRKRKKRSRWPPECR